MNAAPASPVALVTGAASGIGRAIAGRLAQAPGTRVLVLDRDAEGAARAAHEIRAAGGQARAAVVDLAHTEALATALPALCGDWGLPDVLVNNAGIAATVPATAVTLAQWNGTLAVNLTAPMLLIQQALPHMLAQGWGRIVNIASISGVRAGTGRLAYGTSKAALIAMTRQFAIEVAEAGVTVNAVAPGPIDTPLVRQLLAPGTQSAYAEMVPMRRYGAPEDIADAVAFLASPGAGYVTGHTLAVDGGFLASGVFVRHLFDPPTAEAT
ncbi:MAG: SDR family oxidoreductase [Rubrivivax sp.]|nr:SDR family oxidoreductase [Rubrivivax sp.]